MISTNQDKEQIVLKAARKLLKTRKIQALYEHGQWWVWDLRSDKNYSVNNAEGINTAYGLCLEEL
jgi:hypothetical protein